MTFKINLKRNGYHESYIHEAYAISISNNMLILDGMEFEIDELLSFEITPIDDGYCDDCEKCQDCTICDDCGDLCHVGHCAFRKQ